MLIRLFFLFAVMLLPLTASAQMGDQIEEPVDAQMINPEITQDNFPTTVEQNDLTPPVYDIVNPNTTTIKADPVMPTQPANPATDTSTQPQEAAIPSEPTPAPEYEQKKFAVLQTLDKLTARTDTLTVPVGQATAVGPLFLDVKSCQKTPPTELPESSAFLQIWEAKAKPKMKRAVTNSNEPPSQWVFSGWMFASSPALSAMDHPVYDIWLKDCVNEIPALKQK